MENTAKHETPWHVIRNNRTYSKHTTKPTRSLLEEEIIFKGMSDSRINHSSRQHVSTAITMSTVDWEETDVMALVDDQKGDFGGRLDSEFRKGLFQSSDFIEND